MRLFNKAKKTSYANASEVSTEKKASVVDEKTCEVEDQHDESQSVEHPATKPSLEAEFERLRFFHTSEYETFVCVDVERHRETWPIRSKHFSLWIARLYYEITGRIAKSQTIREIVAQMEGKALFNSPLEKVHIRYAQFEDRIYIDLANEDWEQIKILKDGCSIVPSKESPVRFIRMPGMLPLSYPIFGESLTPLWDFLNLDHEKDRILITSWLIGAMRPAGPFPILILQGEQGTAKTTISRLLSSLVDPSILTSRTLPRSERDLAISVNKAWVLGFDNISSLSPQMSDALCRVATGGGLAIRKLYTDDTEMLFKMNRPIILNGISDIATRHDLADRALFINLPPIPQRKRRSERKMLEAWSEVKAKVLGALCDVISTALRNIDQVKLETLPRMADFAEWITAAEPSLPWEKGAFMKEYIANRENLSDIALEADPVGTAVLELISAYGDWSGTPTNLLQALNKVVPKQLQRRNTWPKRPNTLSSRLRQVAPALRKKGIEVERSKSGERNITIRKTGEKIVETVQTVQGPKFNSISGGRKRPENVIPFDRSHGSHDNTQVSRAMDDADDQLQNQSIKVFKAASSSSDGARRKGEL